MGAVLIVEEAGYEAVEASNADEAIRILEADPTIRLVFTDIDMPGSMDGLKLAHYVRGRWPPIKLIVASGSRSLRKLPCQLTPGSFRSHTASALLLPRSGVCSDSKAYISAGHTGGTGGANAKSDGPRS